MPAWLSGRRGLVLGAIAVVGGGAALGWPWLAAIGAAPILLSLLPCVAMCALGLCMGKHGSTAPLAPSASANGPDVAMTAPTLLGEDAGSAPLHTAPQIPAPAPRF